MIDAATGGVLDTQDLNAFVNGKYLIWNVQGNVIFRVVNTSRWTNPALSGIFFDPAEKGLAKLLCCIIRDHAIRDHAIRDHAVNGTAIGRGRLKPTTSRG